MNGEEFLRAVFERDARFDGLGFYGVTSTRIFCRPSCASRRPHPERIHLFATLEAAKNAGFRACLRCRPDLHTAQLDLPGTTRAFEQAAGISNRHWHEAQRITRFKSELRTGKSVNEAQNEAGFGSSRALYERSGDQMGMTPATYGKGGRGTSIVFALSPCELGWLLLARTPKGVCSVMIGEDKTDLETKLRAEFFAAEISLDTCGLLAELEIVLQLLRGALPSPILPLDVRATAFQARIWLELTKIKRGEVITFSELAARLEMPRAVRAVASACAQNPVAIVHPCHRG